MKKLLLIFSSLALINTVLFAKTCNEFKSHKEAKTYFSSKKSGYKSLDRDNDGNPCEGLKKEEKKKQKENIRIRIYQYGSPSGFGKTFSSMNACKKEKIRLTKRNRGLDYSYKCVTK